MTLPQKWPHPHPWSLWIGMCHPAWPKGFADGIKLRRVDGELILGYLHGLNVIPRVLEIGREVGREPERQ